MNEIAMSGNPHNSVLDEEYAKELIEYFRKQTGWKVLAGTPIHRGLTEFSKRYSEEKRDVGEVYTIFRMAYLP